MNAYILLLRGINVGGRNKLPMSDLVSLLNDFGFDNVETLVQSGNVVIKSNKTCTKATITKIAQKIESIHGFTPDIFMLTNKELKKAVDQCPYSVKDGKTLHYFFFAKKPKNPDLEKLDSLRSSTEEYEFKGRTCYLHAPDGVGRSKFVSNFERAAGESVTARNWNTVNKLLQMSGNEP